MAAHHHALQVGSLSAQVLHVQRQLETGPPPWDPAHLVAVATFGQLFTIGRSGQCDDGIGMEVIDMGHVEETMHRGVDARCGAGGAEDAEIEQLMHLVFVLLTPVDITKAAYAVETEHG